MSLRAFLRLLLLPCATVPLYAGWILTRPIGWLLPATDRALQRLWIGTWAKTILWIMGVETRYEGPIPGKDGAGSAYFLVGNHLSYVDIPLLLARLDARFLAKSEIAGWPVLGLLARSTGTLFVDRSRKRDLTRVIAEVKGVLSRGSGVIVFPEGTSTKGTEVERFKPSLFEVPVETGVAVRACALHYDAPKGPKTAWEAVCWWGDAPFGSHFITFLNQPKTVATVTFSDEILMVSEERSTRKDLAIAAHGAVVGSFTPSAPPEVESAASAPHPIPSSACAP